MFVKFGLLFLFASVLPVTLADSCICTRHVETKCYPCMDTTEMPSSLIYGNIVGEDCIPVAQNVLTKHGWKAGIQYGKVSLDWSQLLFCTPWQAPLLYVVAS